MRTRSTRFFVILLHLLGVSNHHLPSWYYDLVTGDGGGSDGDRRLPLSFYSGIRGVHPHSIVLERLDLDLVGGLDGVEWLHPPLHLTLDNDNDNNEEEEEEGVSADGSRSSSTTESTASASSSTTATSHREPFWLQDARDGKCLGPSGGFSECGDATLWFIMRRRSTQSRSLRMGPFGVEDDESHLILEEEPYRYALQIADMDYEQQRASRLLSTKASAATQAAAARPSWLERRQQQRQQDCLVPSFVGSRAFWRRTRPEKGLLELGSCSSKKAAWSWRVDDKGVLYLPADNHLRDPEQRLDARRCLRRIDRSSGAVLADCRNETRTTEDAQPQEQQRLVQFSLVRYHATTATPSTTSTLPLKQGKAAAKAAAALNVDNKATSAADSVKADQQTASLSSNLDKAHSHAARPIQRHSPLLEMNLASRPLLSQVSRKDGNPSSSPFAALKDTNPILFLGEGQQRQTRKAEATAKASITPPPGSYKPRRIEIHPYIEASKNEIWVDPQTGLEYATDLCGYLGHDRKESGRHTLMGVGQYTKTMLKIKVYGIGFYVSKRDILADPVFKEYAGMSADELRKRPDFYEYLRSDASIDRTLFIKTNMQISTETMRSSLDADWKMLTQEAKDLLINTSLRPRPADDNMLANIQGEGNPSHCSCAQTAPENYEPDPSCCARGTEMAFTWRKNGSIEIRLNGRVMDILERPDIARGIFFEYLRLDDPFSLDFIDRTADGFPFLLAPLAQVQGIAAPIPQNISPKASSENVVLKALGGAAEAISSHAVGMAGAMHNGAVHAVTDAANTMQSASDAVKHMAEQMDQKREKFLKHLSSLDHRDPMKLITELMSKSRNDEATSVLNETEMQVPAEVRVGVPHGRVFRPSTSRWFGEILEAPDEIAPILHPTMNKTILSLVHLYLLLLLIVSFPGTQSNRIFVVRRSSKAMSLSASESSLVKHTSSFPEKERFNNADHRALEPLVPVAAMEAAGSIIGCHDASGVATKSRGLEFDPSEERLPSRTSKRFFSRARKALVPSRSTRSADGPPSSKVSLSDDASASSLSPERFQARNCKATATNESMKKSLSYFL